MMPCRVEMTSLWLTESIALAQRWPITLPLVIDPIRTNPIPITAQVAAVDHASGCSDGLQRGRRIEPESKGSHDPFGKSETGFARALRATTI